VVDLAGYDCSSYLHLRKVLMASIVLKSRCFLLLVGLSCCVHETHDPSGPVSVGFSRIISSVHSHSEIATISTNVQPFNVLSKNLGLTVRFSISIPGNVFIGAQESFHDLARAADG
jgi:hypothetical protein